MRRQIIFAKQAIKVRITVVPVLSNRTSFNPLDRVKLQHSNILAIVFAPLIPSLPSDVWKCLDEPIRHLQMVSVQCDLEAFINARNLSCVGFCPLKEGEVSFLDFITGIYSDPVTAIVQPASGIRMGAVQRYGTLGRRR